MKKFLLFSAAVAAGLSSFASPRVYTDLEFRALSANGRYVVSEIFDEVTLVDLETDTKTVFSPTDFITYSLGMGNCVADDGSFLGNISSASPACIFKNGQYEVLPTRNASLSGSANGITPDGRVICGTQGVAGASMMGDGTLSVPCVWEKGEDGNYSLPVMLPYPDKDFTGRAPQYVTAMRISADGNVVAGQVRDYGGNMTQPIVYTRAADGTWSYMLPHPELLNPTDVKFPPYPGDGPAQPDIKNYMTASELHEYELAVEEWTRNAEITGVEDWDIYPNEEDFMSDDSLSNYDAAMAVYNEALADWSIEFNAFNNAYMECLTKGCEFVFNDLHLTSDGKLLATTNRKTQGDYESGTQTIEDTPYIFNLADNTVSFNPDERNSKISAIADSGILLVYNSNHYIFNANVRYPDGNIISLYDYMLTASPAVAEWMKKNMFHDMEVYDYNTQSWVVQNDVPCLGLAICTPDMQTIASTAANDWFENEEDSVYGYILDVARTNDVKVIGTAQGATMTVKGSTLSFSQEMASVSVCDMQGRIVFASAARANEYQTNLGSGLYIVTATAADGNTATYKVRL